MTIQTKTNLYATCAMVFCVFSVIGLANMGRPISRTIAGEVGAQEPQGRPGVIRNFDTCYHITDASEWRELSRTIPEIPCDDRYKNAEEIASWGFKLKEDLKTEESPGNKVWWDAWQASAASGATTLMGRLEANEMEIQKLAEQHADAGSRPFLHGGCQPWTNEELKSKEVLKNSCKNNKISFQLYYWLALQGDHQAQENVADCLNYYGPAPAIQNCNRVVDPDKNMMCAWYLVAASSGHPESSKSAEKYGYIEECDKKPMYERQTILGTASALFLRIYHRPMPLASGQAEITTDSARPTKLDNLTQIGDYTGTWKQVFSSIGAALIETAETCKDIKNRPDLSKCLTSVNRGVVVIENAQLSIADLTVPVCFQVSNNKFHEMLSLLSKAYLATRHAFAGLDVNGVQNAGATLNNGMDEGTEGLRLLKIENTECLKLYQR